MHRLVAGLCNILLLSALLIPVAGHAQSTRPSCVLLAGMDLKPLLGADHDAPVEFGKESCRAEAKSPGRMVVLGMEKASEAELKKWLGNIREMTAKHRGKEATVVNEPTLGAGAFSVREKGKEPRQVEYYATKGPMMVSVQGAFAIGPPLGEPTYAQLRALVAAIQAKLP